MAKQLFDEMLYVPNPAPVTTDVKVLGKYLEDELTRLSGALSAAVNSEIQGIDTSFTTADGTPKTITVTNGLITDEV